MKTSFLILTFILSLFVCKAQVSKSVSNLTPGDLINRLTQEELNNINTLSISGTMDARDFKTMRDLMPKLTRIDLWNSTIAAYTGDEGTRGKGLWSYSSNTLPDFAFSNCKDLLSVFLPDSSITSIGIGAFEFCEKLDYIEIPSSALSINARAFNGCQGLKWIWRPLNVTSIGTKAFMDCSSLTSFTIPASVISLGDSIFYNCNQLTQLIAFPAIPITLLSANVFYGVDKTACNLHIPIKSLSLYETAAYWKDFLNKIAIPIPTRKTIENLTPGTLITRMTSEELSVLKDLELKGTMDARDFRILRDSMPNLSGINLRSITIAAYTGEEGTDQRDENNKIVSYPANTIPTCAFEKCDSLTSVSMPLSTTAIGLAAFEDCHKLMYIDIPRGVTTIGNAAFRYCTALNEITIPSKITSIGAYAFMYCDHLKEISLPTSITTMGDGVFQNCTRLTFVIIPPVTSIADNAFVNCNGLKSVYIPKSVQTIGLSAFSGCDSLLSVIVPNAVSTIKARAFSNCHELTTVTLPASLTFIGEKVFSNCIKLHSITAYPVLPVTLPSSEVFYGVDQTTCTLQVPAESLELYRSANVWKEFFKIEAINTSTHKTITLTPGSLIARLTANELSTTDSLTLFGTIDARDFTIMRDSMPKLAVVDLSSVTIVKYSGQLGPRGQWQRDYPANMTPFSAFENKRSLMAVKLPNSIHTIEIASFEGCNNLSSVNIPSSVTILGTSAFNRCVSLTSVTIPESVVTIGVDAYSSCIGLKAVTIPSSVKTIGAGAFSGCTGLTSFTIPDSVLVIGNSAFWGCDKINAFKIPASVTSIGIRAFSQCSAPITVATENPNYSNLDGVLFNKDQTVLIYCPISKTGSYTIPVTVKKIEESAFSECKKLSVVKLPASIDTIGYSAFYNCTDLANIILPANIKYIGYNAFSGCMSLPSIYIPNSITSIEDGTFFRAGLGSITIPSSVKSIGNSAFYNCFWLKTVYFPNSLDTIIGQNAFSYCTNLLAIHLPDSVTIIKESAFAVCPSLKSVTIPAKVNFIGDRAFASCPKLSSITAYPKVPVELPSPDVFHNVDKTLCTLYVPAESLDLYKAAPVWRDFLKLEAIVTSADNGISNPSISVWPNPARDFITIHADNGVISIYDIQGTLKLTQSIQNNQKVNIHTLPSGVYVVVVNGERFKMVKE